MQTTASKSCATSISSIESAISSRDTNEARMPGVPWVWLSETAIVLNSSGTPPASSTPVATAAANSRCVRLHGMVPVQVEPMPTIGPVSRAGSIPMARKCERAPAREGSDGSDSRAWRRASRTPRNLFGRQRLAHPVDHRGQVGGLDVVRGVGLVVLDRQPAGLEQVARAACEGDLHDRVLT